MKKLSILFCLLLSLAQIAWAQDDEGNTIFLGGSSQPDTLYVLLTVNRNPVNEGEAITRSILPQSEVALGETTFYSACSRSRRVELYFKHCIYDLAKLYAYRNRMPGMPGKVHEREKMVIETKSRAFYDALRPMKITDVTKELNSDRRTQHKFVIDMDKEFPTLTEDVSRRFAKAIDEARIYVIDRNELTPTTVTLIGAVSVSPLGF